MVEMLVVIGILVLLAGILLPMVIRAVGAGEKARASAELQSISAALESYHASFGDYPRFSETDLSGGKKGSELLVEALIAPRDNDGQTGPGFRKRGTQGQVYGPYLPLEKFKYSNTQLQDSFGNAILYIPARPVKPNINANDDFIGPNEDSLYDSRYLSSLTEEQFRYMMDDRNNNGRIDSGETPAYTGPYILWSAGADGTFGPASLTPIDATKCDDVTNFR